MTSAIATSVIGMPLQRLEGRAKVTGTAPYAWEHPVQNPAYAHPLQAAITRGRITTVDAAAALAVDGVIDVLTHENAPRLVDTSDAELAILQSPDVAFRGQLVGVVVADTAEIARYAASLVILTYDERAHDTELRWDREDLYAPAQVNPAYPTDTDEGDLDSALAAAAVAVDQTYTTPMQHNHPMEPHTSIAIWREDEEPRLTLYDSTQSTHGVRRTLAPVLGLEPEQIRVVAPYVGGGFGSKGLPHANCMLVSLAAQRTGGRPVKLALTRQQMFTLAGHRTPTIQRLRLCADADGRITGLAHDVVEHTSSIKEFAEQTATMSRMMYAAPVRSTSHRLAALDVPVPSLMRAPGEAPGSFALESAMDELAHACGLDPIELRVRNDPESDPESGNPWSGRHLVDCLREGAERFGWAGRPTPALARREGDWLVGTGVAAATYPGYTMPGSRARVDYEGEGLYSVRIAATDIGTGAWTALTQIAADALGTAVTSVAVEIGDTDLPPGTVAGGSSGLSSWGSTIVAAARAFRDEHGDDPSPGASTEADMPKNPDAGSWAIHSFGAHFAEVRVHVDTGEVRVPRMLGVFSVGRVVNPVTARSQFIGGMTMGLSTALHEESVIDHATGHVVNQDFAQYHIAAHADVAEIEAYWLDEVDPHINPMGARGIGEIGIVGAAAAIANAAYHATGIRVRDLPLTPDKLLR